MPSLQANCKKNYPGILGSSNLAVPGIIWVLKELSSVHASNTPFNGGGKGLDHTLDVGDESIKVHRPLNTVGPIFQNREVVVATGQVAVHRYGVNYRLVNGVSTFPDLYDPVLVWPLVVPTVGETGDLKNIGTLLAMPLLVKKIVYLLEESPVEAVTEFRQVE